MSAERRLREMGLELPAIKSPAGNYAHAVRTGNLLFLAGKGPFDLTGKLGAEVSVEQGYRSAREAGLALVAVMREELGDLDRVVRIVKVLGLVNATPEFNDHPQVINGCSDLFVEVFGDRGRHARTSVGVTSLPRQITVEIEAIVEIADSPARA